MDGIGRMRRLVISSGAGGVARERRLSSMTRHLQDSGQPIEAQCRLDEKQLEGLVVGRKYGSAVGDLITVDQSKWR
jgi:hypothetical protein